MTTTPQAVNWTMTDDMPAADPPGQNIAIEEAPTEDCPEEARAAAIALAHKLARIDHAPAYVVLDRGQPLLASRLDIGPVGCYWTQDQIIYTAAAPA